MSKCMDAGIWELGVRKGEETTRPERRCRESTVGHYQLQISPNLAAWNGKHSLSVVSIDQGLGRA